jgi:hypothetical protein
MTARSRGEMSNSPLLALAILTMLIISGAGAHAELKQTANNSSAVNVTNGQTPDQLLDLTATIVELQGPLVLVLAALTFMTVLRAWSR